MQATDTRAFLLAMRRKLVKERENINKHIRACDTLLGGPPGEAEWQAVVQNEGLAPPPAWPAADDSTATPVAPPPVSPPLLTAEQRQELLIRAGSRGRGAIQARVELLVAECGEEFSIRDVLSKYEAQYGKDRYRLTESISSSLWKLARKRGYRVVRAGAGSLPTLYGKQRNGQADGNAIRSA